MSRIKKFIMEGIEPYHVQLKKLLFPLFAHIFLELLTAGQKTQGIDYISDLCIDLSYLSRPDHFSA